MYIIPDKYDDKQREVICLDNGYHLVLAPAGCGKTDILAERVRRAIFNGTDVDNMLCLTFTNRASRSMRARINMFNEELSDSLFVGNIHRFCSKFLFENHIIKQSSAIMDDDDAFSAINSVSDYIIKEDSYKDSELQQCFKEKFDAVINTQHQMAQYRSKHNGSIILNNVINLSSDAYDGLFEIFGLQPSIESLLLIYDNSSYYLARMHQYLARMHQWYKRSIIMPLHYISYKRVLTLLDAAKKYETYKKTEGLIDFDDLLILTYDFAKNNSDKIHKYTWVQIDEVQDLNPLQFAIVDAFTKHNNTTVYLGDAQQAIFSFIGAKLETLDLLKVKCRGNLHHLNKCYRSPKYMLDIFNDYAQFTLGTDPDFLPTANNFNQAKQGDLLLYNGDSNYSAPNDAVNIAINYNDGRTAILVPSNKDADCISKCLADKKVPHFKISGKDLFSLRQTKLLLSHLNVINSDINFLAWSRIISSLKIIPSYRKARQFVSQLRKVGLNPSDFILYKRSSYLLEFLRCYRYKTIVVFDTETTGLDVFTDDIVQIAATKYVNGRNIGSLNIILHTDKQIPPMLGNIENPLIKVYHSRSHVARSEGLSNFLRFANGCVLIGHNVQYDFNILFNNCKRELLDIDLHNEFPIVFDTLKLIRLVCPSLHSYKLKDLISILNLKGNNSHLADEDIVATRALADYCFEQVKKLKPLIKSTLKHNYSIAKQLRHRYGWLYVCSKKDLYIRKFDKNPALVIEIQKAYNYFINQKYIEELSKFEYLCDFIKSEVVNNQLEPSLNEQLSHHIIDLNTYKEADLCDSSIVKENIFVATVHKAKGLEFENVIVYGCVDDTYPYYKNKDNPLAKKEDARKLYVAMSRAKKRLCFLFYQSFITDGGYVFHKTLSPFLLGIISRHQFCKNE